MSKKLKFQQYLDGANYDQLSVDKKTPSWVQKIAKSNIISDDDKKTAINQWIAWENGEKILGGYDRIDELQSSVLFFATPQKSQFWHDINRKINNEQQ